MAAEVRECSKGGVPEGEAERMCGSGHAFGDPPVSLAKAFVWAEKVPGRLSFNTQPMPVLEAIEYASSVAVKQQRTAIVYRAAPGENWLSTDRPVFAAVVGDGLDKLAT